MSSRASLRASRSTVATGAAVTASVPRQPLAVAAATATIADALSRVTVRTRDRKPDTKVRAGGRINHLDVPIMGLHILSRYRESEARAFDARLVLGTALLERFEDLAPFVIDDSPLVDEATLAARRA